MKTSDESQNGLGLSIVVLILLCLVVHWKAKRSQQKASSFCSLQFFLHFYSSFHIFSIVIHNRPTTSFFFLLLSWGGVRLSPLGTSATNWPIVPVPDDRWWVWSSLWNENWQGRQKYSEKPYPSATLSTTNPTWPDLSSNSGCRGGNPATNRLSYGTAYLP
jgi:hypothetical protein